MFSYLFDPTPGKEFSYYIPMIILIVLLVAGAIAISQLYAKKKKTDIAFKKVFKKTAGRLSLFAILFTILVLLRYENIPYFSMRIWLYGTLLIFLYLVYKNIQSYRTEYPKLKAHYKRSKTKKKVKTYLPNK